MPATLAGMAIVALLVAGLCRAAWCDLDRLEIPNGLNLGLAALSCVGLGLAVLAGKVPWETASFHLLSGLSLLALGFVAFGLRIIGGGDAKLLAVLALYAGPQRLGDLLLLGALAGGAFTLVLLVYRLLPLPARLGAVPVLARHHRAGGPVPYAVPLVAIALVLFPALPLTRALVGPA